MSLMDCKMNFLGDSKVMLNTGNVICIKDVKCGMALMNYEGLFDVVNIVMSSIGGEKCICKCGDFKVISDCMVWDNDMQMWKNVMEVDGMSSSIEYVDVLYTFVMKERNPVCIDGYLCKTL